jgi:hypothetical protein
MYRTQCANGRPMAMNHRLSHVWSTGVGTRGPRSFCTASVFMCTRKHLASRHAGHQLRRVLSTAHELSPAAEEWSDIHTLNHTYACVLNTSTYGAFEKARTSITTIHAVVTTERLVTAHLTRHRHGQGTACTVQFIQLCSNSPIGKQVCNYGSRCREVTQKVQVCVSVTEQAGRWRTGACEQIEI